MLHQSGNAEKAKGYTKHLPSAYVTYDEMKARLERKKNKVNTSEQRENGKRKTKLALANYKAETRQRLCESETNGDDTITKGYKLQLPQGFVTPKEMEERMAEKRKSAKYRKDRHRCDNNEEEVIVRRNFCSFTVKITKKNGSENYKNRTAIDRDCVENDRDDVENEEDYEKNEDDDEENKEDNAENEEDDRASEGDDRDDGANGVDGVGHEEDDVGKERDEVRKEGGYVQNEEDDEDKTLLKDLYLPSSFRGKSPPFKIIIMNVDGPYDGRGTVPERRRHAIQALILKYMPAVLLLQEFKWKDIRGKIWKACPIPDQYYYQGHGEASLIHNECFITVKDLGTIMRQVLEGLQRSSSNQLKVTFPLHFNPLPRMCSKLLRLRLEPSLSVICISWHGIHKGLGVERKIEYFKYLMEFFRNIHIKMNLPILIGGDFNIAMQYIQECVSKPFKLHKYIASNRRSKAGIIDFFITTDDLNLTRSRFVDLDTLDPESHPNDIFDHDPVYAVLSNA